MVMDIGTGRGFLPVSLCGEASKVTGVVIFKHFRVGNTDNTKAMDNTTI